MRQGRRRREYECGAVQCSAVQCDAMQMGDGVGVVRLSERRRDANLPKPVENGI